MVLVRCLVCVVVVFLCLLEVSAQEVIQGETYDIADSYTITSSILGEEREILISLPPDYAQTNDTYPVHILLDGNQNIEHAVASSRRLSLWSGMPKTIVVAIPSIDRTRDFTPTQDLNYAQNSGGANAFARFIENEVMAFVDSHYRTHPFRVLTGHSLGGLFAASQFVSNNKFFDAYIIMAPALWWDKQETLSKLAKLNVEYLPKNAPVYLGIGEQDGMVQLMQQFYKEITKKYASESLFDSKIYENEGHMSAPLQIFYDGVKHVFSDAIYAKSKWERFTSESFTAFIEMTNKRFGSSVKQTGELYHELASYLVDSGDYSGAITVLQANINAYPNYPFNHKDLANVYALNNQNEHAIAEFKRAAEIVRKSSTSGAGDARQYEREIERLLTPTILSVEQLSEFAGCYQSQSGSVFKFSLFNGTLRGQKEGWADFRMFAENDNTFYTRSLGLAPTYRFDDGSVDVIAHGTVYPYLKIPCD